jgi:DegV family protein with EDD domain
MPVKIVTDSAADIPKETARQLGITIVPLIVRFGSQVYRDGDTITADEFYNRLSADRSYPNTSAPAPGEFARAYEELSRETGDIVSVHVTRKHSAVLESAKIGRQMAEKQGRRIEIIDSRGVTMWEGLVAISAAKAACAGGGIDQVVTAANKAIAQMRGLALLDTLRYAIRGGRLSRTIFAVESILNVKPLLTIRNGEVVPAGLSRTWDRGIERLKNFIKSATNIEDVAVVHGTAPEDAQKLIDYIASLFPGIVPRIARLSPTLGVHAGGRTVLVAIQGEKL